MNDGGPAFPHTHIIGINGMLHDAQSIGGMSLRAYFAGLAMQGLMADPNEDGDSETIARKSIAVADALIAALEVK
ncbi:MAG: hypothetical protein JNK35_03675, partial [Phycisphaerae bacterium]|nr:hypothetical protein [Phycisphaerae bacterium]